MAQKKATENELSELHAMLAQVLKNKLAEGDTTAADIGQIRQFLKDNNIVATVDQDPNMQSIAEMLPTFDDEYDDTDGSYH